MKKEITFKGKKLHLTGRSIKEGDYFHNAALIDNSLQKQELFHYENRIVVLTSFLSLDTPVCDEQVKQFNKRAAALASGEVTVLGISMDLPFAQKRFCEMNDIENVRTLSDYKSSSFGIHYGLLIQEMGLLARAVIIVDKSGTVRYMEIVDEASHAPDYENALQQLEKVIQRPETSGQKKPVSCVPCKEGTPPMNKKELDTALIEVPDWYLEDDRYIQKEFKFQDFTGAKKFVDVIAVIAEDQGHHPEISINYNHVKIILTTHAAEGLTQNDFIIAKMIDEL